MRVGPRRIICALAGSLDQLMSEQTAMAVRRRVDMSSLGSVGDTQKTSQIRLDLARENETARDREYLYRHS